MSEEKKDLTESGFRVGDESYRESNENARTYAMCVHLGAISFLINPLLGLLVPFVVWVTKRREHPFVNHHGKQFFNFSLSYGIYGLVLTFLVGVPLLSLGSDPYHAMSEYTIGFSFTAAMIGMLVLVIAGLVGMIRGAIRAKDGRSYHYPLAIPFFK